MMEALAMMIALLTLLVAGLTVTARSGSRSEERIPVRVRRPDRSSD